MIDKYDAEINQFILGEQHRKGRDIYASEELMVNLVASGEHEQVLYFISYCDELEIVLRACAFFGQYELFKQIPPPSPNKNRFQNKEALLLLQLAAEKGHLELVNFIFSVNTFAVNTYGNVDKTGLEKALCLAAENGHLNVVNCMIKDHGIDPNNPNAAYCPTSKKKGLSTAKPRRFKAYLRCEALYLAAFAGHIEVVLSFLNDPRTGYFDLKNVVYNSPDEKAFIIALAILCRVLLDETLDPRVKRKMLFEIANKLLIRNQKNDLKRLLEYIQPLIKLKLFTSCYGKKAPSEIKEGQLVDRLYGSNHTEVQLLIYSAIERLPDGRIQITFNKDSTFYLSNSNSEPKPLVAKLTHLIPVLGYEISSLDEDSLTFSQESSIRLRAVHCVHFNDDYLTNLINFQSGLRFFYDFYSGFKKSPFWIHLPKELWRIIADFFMKVLHKSSIAVLKVIDPIDIPSLFMTGYPDSSPEQFLLAPNEDGSQAVIKVPLNKSAARESLNKIELCQLIYKALYKGQSSFFKHWNGDLMDKTPKNEKVITDYIAKNPKSRTAMAWDLTNNFVDGKLTKKEVFKAIHEEAYKNSSNLGIFKQSVFENGYDGLEQRIKQAKCGKALEGTRTKDIVDVLDTHPALRF